MHCGDSAKTAFSVRNFSENTASDTLDELLEPKSIHKTFTLLTIQQIASFGSSSELPFVRNTPTQAQPTQMKRKYPNIPLRYLVQRPSTFRLHQSHHPRSTNTHEYLYCEYTVFPAILFPQGRTPKPAR